MVERHTKKDIKSMYFFYVNFKTKKLYQFREFPSKDHLNILEIAYSSNWNQLVR